MRSFLLKISIAFVIITISNSTASAFWHHLIWSFIYESLITSYMNLYSFFVLLHRDYALVDWRHFCIPFLANLRVWFLQTTALLNRIDSHTLLLSNPFLIFDHPYNKNFDDFIIFYSKTNQIPTQCFSSLSTSYPWLIC